MKLLLRIVCCVLALATVLGIALPGKASASGMMTTMGALSAGYYHSLFLQVDGKVYSAGYQDSGRSSTQGWKDIVKISANEGSLGVRKNGTVVYTGPSANKFNVSGWTDIIDAELAERNAIGLKKDGTVVFTGDYIEGQERMAFWRDIIQVDVDDSSYYGLRSDGTVLNVNSNSSRKTFCTSWRNIVAISAGPSAVLGLRNNGTVVAEGGNLHGQLEVDGWHNIVAVSAGYLHSVGLTADGRVVAVGDNQYGQCDTESWYDIVEISAGMYHTIGLRRDGTIVATGSDGYRQCRITEYYSLGNWNGPASPSVSRGYLCDMPFRSKYGKLWTRSDAPASGYADSPASAPGCWSNTGVPGHSQGPVCDNFGNTYTCAMHMDGPESETYSITYNLDSKFTTFSGVVGYPQIPINPVYTPWYTKYFEIYGDGRLLFRSPSMNKSTAPVPFSIDVTGVRALTISWPGTEGPNEAATLFDPALR